MVNNRNKLLKLGVMLACLMFSHSAHAAKPTILDLSVAPDIELTDFNGTTYKLSQFKGKMVALHFWASWCVPCRVEMPIMEAFIKENPQAVVLPISTDSNPQSAMDFLDNVNVSIPLMFGGREVTDAFQVRAIPTTIIVDKDRRFLYRIHGQAPWATKDFKDLMLGFRYRLP